MMSCVLCGTSRGAQVRETQLRHRYLPIQPILKQAVIKWILRQHSRGLSPEAIANHLNKENVRTKRGGQWYSSTVYNVIMRES